jgi:hypothetical protein
MIISRDRLTLEFLDRTPFFAFDARVGKDETHRAFCGTEVRKSSESDGPDSPETSETAVDRFRFPWSSRESAARLLAELVIFVSLALRKDLELTVALASELGICPGGSSC